MPKVTRRYFFLFTLLLVNCFLRAQLDRGLIASYYFLGDAKDNTGHRDGKVVGARLSTDRFGNPNSAYCFDGKDDYITLGTNSDLKQRTMSISLWVKLNAFESNSLNYPGFSFVSTRVRQEVEYYEAYSISLFKENRKFSASVTSSMQNQVSSISRVEAEKDKWFHLVYMFDSDTTYFYVNAELQQKNFKGFVSNYLASDSVVLGYVGNHLADTVEYKNFSWLNGCLDDLKFYNRILSPAEISELYHEPNFKVLTGAVPEKRGRIDGIMKFFQEFWYLPVLLIISIILTIVLIRWRINYIRKKEKEEILLQQKFAQMEMKALRSQMNPHFIFNAINSIQHYVLTNEKELANKYLVKFSQLMRNILDLSKQELISLKDELDTIVLYVDIEALRFNNAFNFKMTVAGNVNTNDIRLPPLLIQPFVENAIWHGLLLKEGDKELVISIFREHANLIIEIEDNGIGRIASEKFSNKELKRRSFGMDITSDRLNVLEKVFGIAISFNVIDKVSDSGQATGTKVIINIKLE